MRMRSPSEDGGRRSRPPELAIRNRDLLNAEIAAREIGELSLPDALAFCLLLADVDPSRFDSAIGRWRAPTTCPSRSSATPVSLRPKQGQKSCVAAATGITAHEAALALLVAQGFVRPHKSRDVAARTLRQRAATTGSTPSQRRWGTAAAAAFDRQPSWR